LTSKEKNKDRGTQHVDISMKTREGQPKTYDNAITEIGNKRRDTGKIRKSRFMEGRRGRKQRAWREPKKMHKPLSPSRGGGTSLNTKTWGGKREANSGINK